MMLHRCGCAARGSVNVGSEMPVRQMRTAPPRAELVPGPRPGQRRDGPAGETGWRVGRTSGRDGLAGETGAGCSSGTGVSGTIVR